MLKWMIACMALLCAGTGATAQDKYEERAREYIKTYKDLAIAEQARSGIPAAITLAQGIHETSAGASLLATDANNHFGIKCKKGWTGLTYAYTDDAPDECFRKYLKPEDSYLDHSDYLKSNPRYASLFKCSPTDYKAWALGLKKCGYATNPRYAQVLIKIIEDYNLQEFTTTALSNKNEAVLIAKEIVPEHDAPVQMTAPDKKEMPDASVDPPPYGVPVKVNGLKAVYAKAGDMPLEYAIKNNIRYERLLEFNEIGEHPLPADMFLYLEKKHTRGMVASHIVKEGETLEQIARMESIQIKSLRFLNLLKEGEEPVAGTVLELQKVAAQKPEIVMAANRQTAKPIVSKSKIQVVNEMPPQIEEAPAESPVEEETLLATTDNAMVAQTAFADSNAAYVMADGTQEAGVSQPMPDQPIVTEGVAAETGVIATSKDIPMPADAAAVPDTTPQGKADLPVPDNTFITKNEIEKVATGEVGPPATAAEVPAAEISKPVEQPVAAKPVETPPAPPAEPEEPKTELDLLKSKFDKVVYATPKPVTPPPAAEPEQPKDTVAEKADEQPKEKIIVVSAAKYYIVKKGDTAFSIAKAHDITVSQLREWNGLDFDAIKVGQKLKVRE